MRLYGIVLGSGQVGSRSVRFGFDLWSIDEVEQSQRKAHTFTRKKRCKGVNTQGNHCTTRKRIGAIRKGHHSLGAAGQPVVRSDQYEDATARSTLVDRTGRGAGSYAAARRRLAGS